MCLFLRPVLGGGDLTHQTDSRDHDSPPNPKRHFRQPKTMDIREPSRTWHLRSWPWQSSFGASLYPVWPWVLRRQNV